MPAPRSKRPKNHAGAQPATRDAQSTQDRLLRTAEQHFVEKGFDLARVDEISADAQVNKRMIYAYFGDKEGLYLAVLSASFGRMLEVVGRAAVPSLDPRRDTTELIGVYFDFLAEHPDFVRLVAWESLRFGRHASKAWTQTARVSLERLFSVLQRGVDLGVFRADLDVRELAGSVYGLCLSHFAQRSFLCSFSDSDLNSPESQAHAREQIQQLVLHGILRPRSDATRPITHARSHRE